MHFVQDRHSSNSLHLEQSEIEAFYDTVGGTTMIDAWKARLTDQDLSDLESNFQGIKTRMTEFDANANQINLRRRADDDACRLESPGPGTPTRTQASISPTPPSRASPDLASSTDQAGSTTSKAQPNTSPTVASELATASTIDIVIAAASVIEYAADEA
ncbi:MAG: hypothetical protein Q9182_007046 [Xanthomendoza sp. 2 TL-2023]